MAADRPEEIKRPKVDAALRPSTVSCIFELG